MAVIIYFVFTDSTVTTKTTYRAYLQNFNDTVQTTPLILDPNCPIHSNLDIHPTWKDFTPIVPIPVYDSIPDLHIVGLVKTDEKEFNTMTPHIAIPVIDLTM